MPRLVKKKKKSRSFLRGELLPRGMKQVARNFRPEGRSLSDRPVTSKVIYHTRAHVKSSTYPRRATSGRRSTDKSRGVNYRAPRFRCAPPRGIFLAKSRLRLNTGRSGRPRVRRLSSRKERTSYPPTGELVRAPAVNVISSMKRSADVSAFNR